MELAVRKGTTTSNRLRDAAVAALRAPHRLGFIPSSSAPSVIRHRILLRLASPDAEVRRVERLVVGLPVSPPAPVQPSGIELPRNSTSTEPSLVRLTLLSCIWFQRAEYSIVRRSGIHVLAAKAMGGASRKRRTKRIGRAAF